MKNCIFCAQTKFKTLVPGIRNSHFQIVKCLNCGLIFTFPQPTQSELEKIYTIDYGAYNELSLKLRDRTTAFRLYLKSFLLKKFFGQGQKLTWKEKFLLFLFQSHFGPLPATLNLRKGKILDVGAGDGFFLFNLKALGWEVAGVEINKQAVEFANSQGLNVFLGTLENAKYPSEFFDVVHLSHVLEHVYDPLNTLKEIYRILKPGGIVIIKVPNFNFLTSKIFKNKLEIQHLYHFTPNILKQVLMNCGFKNLKIKYFSIDVVRSGLPKFFHGIIFMPVFFVIYKFLNLLRLSDSFAIVGYK